MLFMMRRPGRLPDGASRRELFPIGGLGLLGLSFPDHLHQQSPAQAAMEPGDLRRGRRSP
jgi:hypothetical protein